MSTGTGRRLAPYGTSSDSRDDAQKQLQRTSRITGVPSSQLIPQGLGQTPFVANNNTSDGRAQNRRVARVTKKAGRSSTARLQPENAVSAGNNRAEEGKCPYGFSDRRSQPSMVDLQTFRPAWNRTSRDGCPGTLR